MSGLALLAFSLVSAACSMLYELILAKVLSTLSDAPTLWESLSMGTFLLGLGLGAYLRPRLPHDGYLRLLIRLELYLAYLGPLSLLLTLGIHTLYRIYLFSYEQGELLRPLSFVLLGCCVFALLLGIFSGLEFSLLLRFFNARWGRAKAYPFLAAVYNLGGLVAALLYAYVLIEVQSPLSLSAGLGLLNGILALLMLLSYWRQRFAPLLAPVALGLVLGAALFILAPQLEQLHLKNLYYNELSFALDPKGGVTQVGPRGLGELWPWLLRLPEVKRLRSPYQDIDVVPEAGPYLLNLAHPERRAAGAFTFFLNGHFQFSSSKEALYHESLAHVPFFFWEQRIEGGELLVLGGGDGLLLRELLKYPDFSKVSLVELDAVMLELARSEPLRTLNAGALEDGRVDVTVADAFAWLRSCPKRYSAVFMDVPSPYSFEGLRLYSKEFLSLLRNCLRDDGFLALDAPVKMQDPTSEENLILFSTLYAAGFAELMAYAPEQETFVLALPRAGLLRSKPLQKVKLKVLDPDFTRQASRLLRVERSSDFEQHVHSVFKPRSISYSDVRF